MVRIPIELKANVPDLHHGLTHLQNPDTAKSVLPFVVKLSRKRLAADKEERKRAKAGMPPADRPAGTNYK
ncbi:hypothetical protein, partial [Azospirillum sp. B4]|uniref:hypothetical protein n=1 Tax=Azospirillum sp. B4 TaxID=95605 RepID=UPI0005C82593